MEKEERARAAEKELEAFTRNAGDAQPSLWRDIGAGEEETLRLPELREAIQEYRARLAELDPLIRETARKIEETGERLDHIAEEEERLVTLTERLDAKQHRYEIIASTDEYMSRARAAFTARYMEPIKRSFDAYYTLLAGEGADDYMLDADLRVTARACGARREIGLLSEGYQDLVGLCRRMAMIDAMYEEEKPFLLFDDPFVNLDGPKLERALSFLRSLSSHYQILYFTCHESRVP